MDHWLRAADILVTKAGPNSLAEAFVMGLPTVIYAAIPGQEDGNVTLVKEQGAGIWAPGPSRSVEAVLSLLDDPLRRERMTRQAQSLATPDGSTKIAQRLWRLTSSAPA
jgi:1,2-diacylglycerol 3-beta-galactosyltransferase